MVDVAEIRIWGELVGAVRWDSNREIADFQYAKKFLQKGIELSPIILPVKNGDRIYRFPELRKKELNEVSTFKGLPGLLADALPDRYGNQLINSWLAKNGRLINSMNPVEQLCFIGKRGMGALEFEPAQFKSNKNTFAIEIDSLVDIARKMLSNREEFKTNLHGDEEKAMKDILRIGTSAGGARPKAVIAYNKKNGEIRSGQTAVPKGFEHWLIKLDGVSDVQFGTSSGYGRVEYAYYLMAEDCGIQMMDCRLLEENGRAHFMTRRFDRDGHDTKHHVQTFCAIQHFDYCNIFSYSYEQLFQTMRKLRLPYPQAEEMFRRMVFNVLATNYDDHTKNFSFRLKQNSRWELSPAYDMCYAFSPSNNWVNQHTLSLNGKYREITRKDLLHVASHNNIKKAGHIIDQVKEVICNWDYYSKEVGVSSKLKDLIGKTLIAYNFK